MLYGRVTAETVQTELVQSAEYLKHVTDWDDLAKWRLRRMQSDVTKKVVDQVQGKIK